MPSIPTQDNFNVTPNVRRISANPQTSADAGALAAQQLRERGQTQMNIGQQAVDYTYEKLSEANRLRVDDALNRARELATDLRYNKDTGYENLKGLDALERPEEKPLADEYRDALERQIGEIEASLGNDAQREAFRTGSGSIVTGFYTGAKQYEGAQYREYAKSVRRGTIDQRLQQIALQYDDPAAVSEAVLSIKAAGMDLAKREGMSATEAEAFARKYESEGHATVIGMAMEKGNYEYAENYFNRNASSMDPDTILRVKSQLWEQLDTKIAIGVSSGVINGFSNRIETPDSERAFNIAIGTESNGMQFGAPGSVAGPNEPSESSAGAIGIAQVMPDTAPEAAKLAGLEFDEERYRNDAEYNRALGKAYFEKQLRDNKGSLAKAYAAYNAGPGRLAEAEKRAEKEGGSWIDYMPSETQNYVKKNMNEYTAGKGRNAQPSLRELQDAVREQIGTENPRRLKLALQDVETRYKAIKEENKTRDDAAVADAFRELIANGGKYDMLSPQLKSKIPPTEVGKVMDFAKKLATRDDITTNLKTYNRLTENPELLKALTNDQFEILRSELSDSDFKHFAKERGKLINGDVADGKNPENLNSGSIKQAVDARLTSMGVNPNSSFKDGKAQGDTVMVGNVRKLVNDLILQEQRERGRPLNDAETIHFVDKIFAQRTTYERMFSTPQGPIVTMAYDDIPSAVQKQMKQAFKTRGIEATEDDILNAYRAQLMTQKLRALDEGSY